MSIRNRLISGAILKASYFYESWLIRMTRYKHRTDYDFDIHDPSQWGKISIILPTYNRSEMLFDRAIPSVLSQTYSNWELLVVSHGCTDSTDHRVESLCLVDPRVKLVRIEREKLGYPPSAENHWLVGPVKPINAGLSMVTGLWVARIDDDDIWSSDHLMILIQKLVETGAEFISSAYEVIDESGTKVISPTDLPRVGGVQTWLYRSYLTFFRAHLSCWRKSWNRVNDTDMQERMINAGVIMEFCEEITAIIKPRPGEKYVGSRAYLSNSAIYEEKYGKSN